MATSMWRYRAEIAGRYYRLLLLDEPEAHLHPSLTRRFLNVLKNVFVEQRNVRVIMTTHSPSTVALTPEDSLFEMRRTTPRIRAVGRAEAISALTGGFVAVQDATRTVLVEGKDDPPFYRVVWEILTERVTATQPGTLEPYPNLNFVHGQGRQTVRELVRQLRFAGFANFCGIIDKDRDNQPDTGVLVLDRCAIENYLYDPLNIWLCLRRRGCAPEIGGDPREFHTLRNMSIPRLQGIIESVTHRIEELFPPQSAFEAEKVMVRYGDVTSLFYPRWCLTRGKSDIAVQNSRTFVQIPRRELLESYAEVNMIPDDLVQLYRRIQAA